MTSRSASDRLNYFPLAAPTTSPHVGIRVCFLPNWHWVVPTHPPIRVFLAGLGYDAQYY